MGMGMMLPAADAGLPGYAEFEDIVGRRCAGGASVPAAWLKSMRTSARSAQPRMRRLHLDGSGEQALVAADLGERLAIGEGEAGRSGCWLRVEQAEAVEARLDVEEGTDLAVDEDAVGAELGDPRALGVAGDVVEELAGRR